MPASRRRSTRTHARRTRARASRHSTPSSSLDGTANRDRASWTASAREPQTGAPPVAGTAVGLGENEGGSGAASGSSARVTVSEPGDRAEREADRVSDAVVNSPSSASQIGDGTTVRDVRRSPSEGRDVGPGIERKLEAIKGNGHPLPEAARSFFEPRFDRDFGDVRIHTGPGADEIAQSLDAEALTSGRDVIFRSRSYEPGSQRGKKLIAHELTHVAQQGGRTSQASRRSTGGGAAIQRQHVPYPLGGGGGGQTKEGDQSTVAREEEEGGPGPITKAGGDVSVRAGTTMTAEATLREVYDKAAREISEEALRMVKTGEKTTEEAARWAVRARNDLKVKIRAKGSPITRGLAEARNIRKYGRKTGPTYDELIRKGKTPEDIIGSAGKSSKKVTRATSKLRILGRFAIAVDVAIVTWEVHTAPEDEKLKTAVAGTGGIAGAIAGGWAGAKGGAWAGGAIGGALGSVIPGAGTAGGAAVGGALGGLIGGVSGAIAGGMAGRAAGEAAYEYAEDLYTPNLDSQMREIDRREDSYIRENAPN